MKFKKGGIKLLISTLLVSASTMTVTEIVNADSSVDLQSN